MHIALLRAINVGGRNLISMSDLRDLFTSLGLAGARTLLQSGNVVFAGDRRVSGKLERLLEIETATRFGLSVDYVVRSCQEWREATARNPFPEAAKRDPGRLGVMFLKESAEATNVKALQAAIKGPEILRADGKHLYIVYPDGMGKSKLTITLIEKHIGCRGTMRNWNTVLKLATLASEK